MDKYIQVEPNTILTIYASLLNEELTVDASQLTSEVLMYLLAYGLKQRVNDAGALGKLAPLEAKQKASREAWENLLAGIVPSGGGGGRNTCPVQARMLAILENLMQEAHKATKKEAKSLAKQYLVEANDEQKNILRETAKKQIREEQEQAQAAIAKLGIGKLAIGELDITKLGEAPSASN